MLFFSSGWAQSPKDFKVVRSDTIADGSIVFHHREDVWEGAEWDASRGFSEIRLSSSGKNVRLIDTIEIVAGYFPAFPTSDRKLVLFESMGKIFLFDPVSNHSSFVARGVFPHVLSSLKEGFFYFVFDPVVSKRKKFMEGENFFAVFFGKYVGRAAKLGNLKVLTSETDMGGYNPLAWVDVRLADPKKVTFSGRGIQKQEFSLR